ncbi:MAG: exodeoxyribonuclease VII small subunit [Halobacteria archaeon]
MTSQETNAEDHEGSFEESFERLEEIVDELESGDLSLDDAVDLYEEGVGLVDTCRGRLDEVEHRLEVLDQEEGTENKEN